jgi:hypothetical protein
LAQPKIVSPRGWGGGLGPNRVGLSKPSAEPQEIPEWRRADGRRGSRDALAVAKAGAVGSLRLAVACGVKVKFTSEPVRRLPYVLHRTTVSTIMRPSAPSGDRQHHRATVSTIVRPSAPSVFGVVYGDELWVVGCGL